jgi:AraC family transcriptional regulator of arabinose operon
MIPYSRIDSNRIDADGVSTSNGMGAEAAAARPMALARMARDKRLHKVIQMIESDAPGTVHALALEVNLSSSHLQHLFKQQTGVCITQLLTEQRLLKAAHLLEASDLSIKQVAYAVGYEHASSFIRAFQRRFAQTPGDYRMHNGQQAPLTV